MANAPVISARNLTKVYHLYDKPLDRLKEALSPLRRSYHKDFYAIKDLSFDVGPGQVVAIFGRNGSGKSTLLKMIASVLTPTSGAVSAAGRVSALLELGAGFNPELSGTENVFLYGSMIGYSRKEMEDRLDDIIAFAEIGDFIHRPVKLYSSGMFSRLAFSTYIHVDPDVLIVDEVLAVGDIRFQVKCRDRLMELREQGTTILYVSHGNPGFGDWAMILEKGEMLDSGSIDDMWNVYHKLMTATEGDEDIRPKRSRATTSTKQKADPVVKPVADGVHTEIQLAQTSERTEASAKESIVYNESSEFLARVEEHRFGTGEVRFVNTELLDERLEPVSSARWGQKLCYRLHMRVDQDVPFLAAGFMIRNTLGHHLLGDESWAQRVPMVDLHAGDRVVLEFAFDMNLNQGDYTLTIGSQYRNAEMPGEISYFDWIDNCDVLSVQPPPMPVYSWYHVPTRMTARIDRASGVVPDDIRTLVHKYEAMSRPRW